jgi:biopolymer transport protein TolR
MKVAKARSAFSEINVTPLVDVMLVLLIIFMVTAPVLQSGLPVDLPQAQGTALPGQSEELVLTISSRQEIFVNRYPVKADELEPKIKEILGQRTDKTIYLRADKTVPYGFVVMVMSELMKAGAKNIGVVTEAEAEKIEK